ncbi:MAG: sensor histidine kinase, partial [Methanospirillum sp.]|uniref:sensor histidine kinase n=1 Tax=Methanospirillum sp. TaxID=45200 RepID=UPI0023732AD2
FLIEDHKDDPDLVAFLTDIFQSAEKIKSIIESINLELVSATKEPQWLDVYQLFQPAVKQAEDHGLVTCIVDNNVEVFSYSYLNKIFAILTDNTIRHGGKVTTITMSAECTEDGLALIYEDNGIGIPTKDKEKIFLKYFGKNTGEGLYYARSLLSLLGITIQETGRPGRGVKFELKIPANYYRQIV